MARFIVSITLLAMLCLPAHPQANPSAPALYRIAGKVVNAVTGEPVRRATVTALAEADSHAVASTVTDSDGHFELDGLPAAKYPLTASRRGFRTAFYDEHDEFYSAIVTGPGQDTSSLIFRLTPGSVLRGVVTGDGGDPVQDAEVMLFLKPHGRGPGARITEVDSTSTDDTGAYEFNNLASGAYLLAVKATPWYAMHSAHSRAASAALDVAYPITYFDSTTDEASASTIVLAGGNREEADFVLHAVPALHLTLDVPRSVDGSNFAPAMPQLRQTIFGAKVFTETASTSGNPRRSTVEFDGVAPGHYELAQGNPPRIVSLDANSSQQVDPALGTPTVAVSGTLRSSNGSALPDADTVVLDSLDPAHRQSSLQADCVRGAFSFASVPPGMWELWAGNSEKMLPIASIAAGGRAHAGNQVTVRDQPLSLLVTISVGDTRVEGFARKDGKGVPGVMIVLAPRDRFAWRDLIRRDQSDSDGSFSLRDVVPGQYILVAIEDGWALDWTQPDIIGRYLPNGIAITVSGSSGKLVNLDMPVPVQSR